MNSLKKSLSPYLRQHADNPVLWREWGEDAFELAKKLDKPVFLSIGYSTCHWCHVMAHESFEDTEVAELINREFVPIKVDREELPDIDSVYMTACQMMTGSGGWPLTLFLTPEKKPFFAATYIPKTGRFGRTGLMELIPHAAELWKTRRADIEASADSVGSSIAEYIASPLKAGPVDPNSAGLADIMETAADLAFERFDSAFDPEHGGFDFRHGGHGPKFPMAQNIKFLLYYSFRTSNTKAREIVKVTLDSMRSGGVYDQAGSGFHRYSTDAKWLLPHFEKMLYDQASMLEIYAESARAFDNGIYAKTAMDIADFVIRELLSAEGLFYSALDADSEGEEGKFYLWTSAEIKELLGPNAEYAEKLYGIMPEGNHAEEATGHKTGKNVLFMDPASISLLENEQEKIAGLNAKLLEHRAARVRPMRDEKILTDWNGMIISALAHTGRILGEKRLVEAAARAAESILKLLRGPNGPLLHRRFGDVSGIPANLDDYSFVIKGMIELYLAVQDKKWLDLALQLTAEAEKLFASESDGGYFFTQSGAEDIFGRRKDDVDNAMPAGNSVMFHNVLILYRITGDASLGAKLEKLALRMTHLMKSSPESAAYFMSGVELHLMPPLRVEISGDMSMAEAGGLLNSADSVWNPSVMFLYEHQAGVVPSAKLCRGDVCLRSEADPYAIAEFISGKPIAD